MTLMQQRTVFSAFAPNRAGYAERHRKEEVSLKIVMLPGMDGTGILFKALVRCFSKEIDIEVVCLNDTKGTSYLAQSKEIAQRIGTNKIVLVAESYSGRIAYEICSLLNDQVVKVVFIASFVSNPNPLTKLAGSFPAWMLNSSYLPDGVFNYFCFSGYGTGERIKLVRNTLASVNLRDLRQRLRNMAALVLPERTLNTNATYIQPTNDRLVGEDALRDLRKIYINLQVQTIAGGHFVAQSNPEECARVIQDAVTT